MLRYFPLAHLTSCLSGAQSIFCGTPKSHQCTVHVAHPIACLPGHLMFVIVLVVTCLLAPVYPQVCLVSSTSKHDHEEVNYTCTSHRTDSLCYVTFATDSKTCTWTTSSILSRWPVWLYWDKACMFLLAFVSGGFPSQRKFLFRTISCKKHPIHGLL